MNPPLRRLDLAFWVSPMLLALATGAGVLALRAQQEALDWVVHTHEVIEELERTSSLLKDAETGQRGYLLTGNPSFLAPYLASQHAIASQLHKLGELTGDNPGQQRALSALRDTITAKLDVMSESLRLYRTGAAQAAIDIVRTGRGAELMDDLRAQIARMTAEEDRLLRERRTTAARYRAAGLTALILTTLLALGLLWLLRSIAKADAARIRASEERLATTLASIGDGVIATDTRGRVERMNVVASSLTGWSETDAIGKPLDEIFRLVDAAGQPLADSPAHRVLRGGASSHVRSESRMLSRDGIDYPVEADAAPIGSADGSPGGVVVVFRDVTARQHAERARDESERRYREVLEALPQLVWTCASSGEAQYLSQQWLQYTGATLETDLGYGWAQRIHPDDRPHLLHLWTDAVRTGAVFDTEARIRQMNGEYRWFKQRAVPLREAGGSIKEWFGTSTEITDVIEAREEVRRANALLERRVEERTLELQEANTELQAFAHSVAHDLRAPLRNIQGYAEAILEDERERLSQEGALYAKRLADSASRLDDLIQDLLEYSRLSRAEIHLERVELSALVRRALLDMASEISMRKASIEVADQLPAVIAHGPTLGQVLVNLLTNAIKFVAADAKPRVRVSASTEEDRVQVSIADNGIGIAREHRERIFRVFERLHGSDHYPGTGIGLAIVRRGIERMGGRVWIESSDNGGTRFVFELQAARAYGTRESLP